MELDTDPTKLKAKPIIKPKVEPCDDDDELPPPPPPPASGSGEDWEATTPLAAGNPFFTALIAKSHLHPKFQMVSITDLSLVSSFSKSLDTQK